MKRLIKTASYIGNVKVTVLVCMVAAVLLHTGMQTPTLGIMPAQVRGEIDYIVLARWLGMMAVPILLNGYYLSRCKNVEMLSLIHLKSTYKWLHFKLVGCFVNTLVYTTALSVPVCILRDIGTARDAFLLLLLNNSMWMLGQLLLDEMLHSSSVTGLCVTAIICFCFVCGERLDGISTYIPSSWGMICRASVGSSGNADIRGFLFANMAAILLSLLLLHYLHRKRRR